MLLRIDESGDLPIYEQIIRQMMFSIASDVLSAGDLAPSVRELSKQAAINPTTVTRAYTRLQDAGILCRRRGKGLVVTAEAAKLCRDRRVDMIRSRLRQVFLEARQSGLGNGRLEALVQEELNASKHAALETAESQGSAENAEPGEQAATDTTSEGPGSDVEE